MGLSFKESLERAKETLLNSAVGDLLTDDVALHSAQKIILLAVKSWTPEKDILPLAQARGKKNPIIEDQGDAFYSYDGILLGISDSDNDNRIFVSSNTYDQLTGGDPKYLITQQDLKEFKADAEKYPIQATIAEGQYFAELPMTAQEFLEIAGTIYAEDASTPEVAKAIYSVVRNRARFSKLSEFEVVKDVKNQGIYGWKNHDDILKEGASKTRKKNAFAAVLQSYFLSVDWSNGAYVWQGTDFADRKMPAYTSYYLTGFRFTDPAHDIWGLGNHESGNSKWVYKYESTAVFGQTTFMNLTDEWKTVNKYRKPW